MRGVNFGRRSSQLRGQNCTPFHNLVENAARVGAVLKKRLHEELGDHPIVGDIRGEGLMIGVELVADRETKQELDLTHKVGPRIMAESYNNGILITALPHRTVLAMSPPLTLTHDNVEELVSGLKRSISAVHEELVRDKVDLAKHKYLTTKVPSQRNLQPLEATSLPSLS